MALQILLSQSHPSISYFFTLNLRPIFSSTKIHLHHSLPKLPNYTPDALHLHNFSLRRSFFNLSIVTGFISFQFFPSISEVVLAKEGLDLERYVDSKEGFTLLIPSSWIKVDKAGATVLFEEANQGSNNVGVVVNPVRLNNLGEFGSPQFVADKLIQAERRKESTKDAKVIQVAERSGKGGLQIYEFEYEVDSTRGGIKRIFSAAFVASKKLYVLNISNSDKPESPLDSSRRTILEEILHSFQTTDDSIP